MAHELNRPISFVPQLGCTAINAEVGATRYTLQATASFQRADMGVPGWEAPLRMVTQLASFAR